MGPALREGRRQKQDQVEEEDLSDFSYPHREPGNHSFIHCTGWPGSSNPIDMSFEWAAVGQGMTLGEVALRQSEGLAAGGC